MKEKDEGEKGERDMKNDRENVKRVRGRYRERGKGLLPEGILIRSCKAKRNN